MAEALIVGSPVAGRVVAMRDVPDPVFAESIVAPCAGVVVKLHPHAYVLLAPPGGGADGASAGEVPAAAGRGVLVHLGIDTVQLKGEGFTLLVAEGDTVEAGQELIAWSPSTVSDGGRSPLVPVVALDLGPPGGAGPSRRTRPGRGRAVPTVVGPGRTGQSARDASTAGSSASESMTVVRSASGRSACR
jgi:phosphotransferase system IIA component